MDKLYKIHTCYIIAFLVFIIIGLITIEWGAIEGLVGYIDFAATVTSLAVGLLAIAYTIYSNSTFSKNSADLSNSSKLISNESKNLSAQINILEDRLQILPKALDDLQLKSDKTIEHLEQLKNKEFLLKNQTRSNDNVNSIEPISESLIEKLLENSSIAGMWTLYMIKSAFENDKQLNIEKASTELKISNYDYVNGFLTPLYAMGLYKMKEVKNGEDYDELITYVNQHLLDKIYSKMEEMDLNNYNDPKMERWYKYLTRKVKVIDEYMKRLNDQ